MSGAFLSQVLCSVLGCVWEASRTCGQSQYGDVNWRTCSCCQRRQRMSWTPRG
jgi:hypothetical protein